TRELLCKSKSSGETRERASTPAERPRMVAGNLRVIFGAKSIPEVVTIPTMTPCHFQRPGEPLPKRNAFWKAKKLRQLSKDDDQSDAPQITRDDLVRDELDQPAAANQSV